MEAKVLLHQHIDIYDNNYYYNLRALISSLQTCNSDVELF